MGCLFFLLFLLLLHRSFFLLRYYDYYLHHVWIRYAFHHFDHLLVCLVFRNEHHGDFIAPLDKAGFNTQTINLNNPVLIDDGSLKITAYSVTHDPVDPALGFRIDYKGRSISISGDTSYDENLIKNSNNVDVLFHESMSVEFLNILNRVSKETDNIVGEIVTMMFKIIIHQLLKLLRLQIKQM